MGTLGWRNTPLRAATVAGLSAAAATALVLATTSPAQQGAQPAHRVRGPSPAT